jgi:hypothetical protein
MAGGELDKTESDDRRDRCKRLISVAKPETGRSGHDEQFRAPYSGLAEGGCLPA